jgi:tetratricopeptide (TPR) repeat protein
MPDDLATAVECHRRGLLTQAAGIYERLLADDPENADLFNLLGVVRLQQGDPQGAVERIGRAVGLEPSVAAFHANLGEAYRAAGDLGRAVGCCRTALGLQPAYPEAANNLGLALMALGQMNDAVAQFQAALQLQPDFAMAHNNLANALRSRGDCQKALAHFRRAAEINPQLVEARSNLGQLLLEQGQLEEALVHCREAVRLNPASPQAQNNLGNVLRELGRLADAKACYAEAVRLSPDLAMTWNNMGQALQEEGRVPEAITWYRRALELSPDFARAHWNLGSALGEQEDYQGAIASYETALRLAPGSAEAHNGLGWILHEQGHFTRAMEYYRRAIALKPDMAAAHAHLGIVLEELGDFAAAERSFREALGQDPRHGGAHAHLATLLRDKLPEADLEAQRRLLADPLLPDGRRSALHFGLAHVLDARGAYAEAAEHLKLANALGLAQRIKRGRGYDPALHERFVDGMIATCAPAFFERVRDIGLPTERPVFVVGLPRSGTTLVEQILASHSQVFAAGELPLGREDFESLSGSSDFKTSEVSKTSEVCGVLGESQSSLEGLARLDRPTACQLAQRHLEALSERNDSLRRVVDKMPDNTLYLGLLAVLFPRAQFIYCRRDLRDVAVSCWMTNFRHIPWAHDPDHIAARFEQHQRLMAHWRQVLPVPLLEIDYERTVADLEGTARRIVAWCGLDWEPACVEFHRQTRPVRTASVTQVRQPIYTTSVQRWKHYAPTLTPLFDRLTGASSHVPG